MNEVERLLAIMRDLRDPETGCPWDKVQTFNTIAPYTIEEAYEVADAIEQQDYDELKKELGDLLLQVVYHSQIASEENLFAFEDVVKSISDKMVSRHPHVFADKQAKGVEAVKDTWESLKAKEREDKDKAGVMDDMPINLPALIRAYKIQKRAANVGFDWDKIEDVSAKVQEELAELEEAYKSKEQRDIQEEMGDLLFSVVNLSRHMKVKPEEALRQANYKFIRRFEAVEILAKDAGKQLKDCSLEEMDDFWNEVKHSEE